MGLEDSGRVRHESHAGLWLSSPQVRAPDLEAGMALTHFKGGKMGLEAVGNLLRDTGSL